VQTNAVASYDVHPIARLVVGVSTGINTDARTNTNITLSEEYERLAATFGWSARDFLARTLDAVEASFTDDATKASAARSAHARVVVKNKVSRPSSNPRRSKRIRRVPSPAPRLRLADRWRPRRTAAAT
jgi:adenosine deaminase